MSKLLALSSLCLLLACGGCQSVDTAPAHAEVPARLFEGLGTHHRVVTTNAPAAQAYFDQGLIFAYSFNLDEAVRSFSEASRLDPACAMAWWGVALCNGPHINSPDMDEAHSRAAWAALQKARGLVSTCTPVERAMIEALEARYADPGRGPLPLSAKQRQPLDSAYAQRMKKVWEQFPEDADAGTLYAEAMMDLRPWDLWTLEGQPQPGTDEIVATLEGILAKVPNHPGANHLYVHAVEASPMPRKALVAAQALETLVPAAGHMVHMPAHIYARVGMWEKAAEANRKAIAADAAYNALVPQRGFYQMYMAHNRHFLAYACMMEGRSQEALAAARDMLAAIPPEFIENAGPMIDGYLPVELEVLMRFGRWEEILAKKEPPAPLPISTSIWHMCRGVAFANTGKIADARAEQKLFLEAKSKVPADATVGNSPASTVLEVAEHILAGEISFKDGAVDSAIDSLLQAAKTEDTLRYDEPPNWMHPSRHILGAVLLSAGRAQDAGIVYRDDLSRWPENGWALFGLSEAIKAQLAPNYTKTVIRFQKAWQYADVQIDSSCACVRPANK